ncbi:MAG: hypothetical protein RL215_747 [Planctomycetota bacterium]|jgi:hypothetical protein
MTIRPEWVVLFWSAGIALGMSFGRLFARKRETAQQEKLSSLIAAGDVRITDREGNPVTAKQLQSLLAADKKKNAGTRIKPPSKPRSTL